MIQMFWFERPYYLKGIQVNPYYWYWHDYRCRLEPWTYEWRRYAQKWWWVILIKTGVCAALFLWMLLFPLSNTALWIRVLVIVVGVIGVVFYAWLLLHLGGFALRIIRILRRR